MEENHTAPNSASENDSPRAKSQGWVKVHRELLDHWCFEDSETLHIWIYLLLRANHIPRQILFDGKVINLKAGQLITSRDSIAANTGIHESKVQRVLKRFESGQQIEQVTSSRSRLIYLIGWEQWQAREQLNEPPANNGRTTGEQPANADKKVKNGENEKKLLKARGSLEEMMAFAVEIGLPESDGEAMHWKLVGKGWKDVKDWRAVMRQWKSSKWHPSQKNPNGAPKLTVREQDKLKTGIESTAGNTLKDLA